MATDRRTRFRDYMRRLDPTGDPAQAVAGGFYVPPPNAVSQRIATRLELEPASSHLLVGGIGSGKTTELIAIERKLAEVEDLFTLRVDVPSRHRLDKLKPGVLIALAATEVCAELRRARTKGAHKKAAVEQIFQRISALARGRWIEYEGDDTQGMYWAQGVLEDPGLSEDLKELSEALGELAGMLQRKPVILFDGLDRVADLALAVSVLAGDVPAISRAGVGLVLVGPQRLLFGSGRSVISSFGTVHLHGAAGVDTDEGREFLTAVLRARADDDVLPTDSAAALALASGGVLRDLVALGREAGANAYNDGSDAVQISHVNIAADRFGRDLLLGCTKEMVARLKEMAPKKLTGTARGFFRPAVTIATELDQRLLMDRLIIEIPGIPVRYILHPTIVPLIPGLGGS